VLVVVRQDGILQRRELGRTQTAQSRSVVTCSSPGQLPPIIVPQGGIWKAAGRWGIGGEAVVHHGTVSVQRSTCVAATYVRLPRSGSGSRAGGRRRKPVPVPVQQEPEVFNAHTGMQGRLIRRGGRNRARSSTRHASRWGQVGAAVKQQRWANGGRVGR